MSHKSCFLAGLTAMLVLSCGMPAFSGKPPAISYQIVQPDLGPYQRNFANGISNRDATSDRSQVVGAVADAADHFFPARWTISRVGGVQSALELLPLEPSMSNAGAYGINDIGEIVGVGWNDGSAEAALYWADAEALPEALPQRLEDIGSAALAINNEGVICGFTGHEVIQNEETVVGNRAVVWRVSPSGVAFVELPPAASHQFAWAAAISDLGANGDATVVGSSSQEVAGATSAVAWTVHLNQDGTLSVVDSQARVLNQGAPGEAYGVNNAGTVCGAAWTPETSAAPVVWMGNSRRTLSSAKFFYPRGAYDINNNGMIVGWGWYQRGVDGPYPRAMMWPSATGSLTPLSQFLDSSSPFGCLTDAHAVNDSGEIVGLGWDGVKHTAFIAIPK
jgi:uncharacterized membrane protein